VATGEAPADFDAPTMAHDEYATAIKDGTASRFNPAVTPCTPAPTPDWLALDGAVRKSWQERHGRRTDVAFAVTEGAYRRTA